MKGKEDRLTNVRIGQYKILDVIAKGGSGTLYRAVLVNEEGEEDELYYAVKEVGYTENEVTRYALANEKEVTHSLENHSGFSIVIPVLQVITQENIQYAVMPYKKSGRFLTQLIQDLEGIYGKGQIPVTIVFALIRRILQSLSVLHHSSGGKENQEGYLHMDIQPSNIFIENIDVSKMEFGSAKFIDLQNAVPVIGGYGTRLTENIYATPGYAAPEMFREGKQAVKRASDLYSVGCVLARMLTGNDIPCSFDYDVQNYLKEGWCTHRSDLDAATRCLLKKLLLCALETGMEMRYQLVWEMEQDLEQAEVCYRAFLRKDYYSVYAHAWEMLIRKEELLAQEMGWDLLGFEESVKKLEKSLLQDQICPPKYAYIYYMLHEMEVLHEQEVEPTVKVSLIFSGITCANHMGNSVLAMELYEKLDLYKEQIPIMDYLAGMNRAAEIYADLCDYETAMEIAARNVHAYSYIKEAYQKAASWNHIAGNLSTRVTGLGRSWSAKGRYEAF